MEWPNWRADLFDPRKVPFSRRGSFIAISWIAEDGAFWLRNLRGGDEHTDLGRMLRLEALDGSGKVVEADWRLAPDCLTLRHGFAEIRLSFDGADRISLAGQGMGLRLRAGPSKYNYAQAGADHIHVCIATQDLRCNIAAQTGLMRLDAVWNGLSSDAIAVDLVPHAGAIAATFDLFRITPALGTAEPQAQAQLQVAQAFADFRANLPKVPPDFAAGELLASYILWSAYVPAEGALSQPSVYMSKNWMTNIWSWDHCFVALAFGALAPDLAFEQMQAIFDAQDASGRLPDYINDRYAYWAFTKPPVHGWTFAQLRAMRPDAFSPGRLAQVVGWLEAQVGFWMSGPKLGLLPAYRHGNDAGWDNATCFAEGGPLASPDLATFLILQLDEIAAIHRHLGHETRARTATAQADALCAALCNDLWDGNGFVAKLAGDGRVVRSGQSLLLFLPMMLGDRLPAEMRAALMAQLFQPGRYLTAQGLSTEATDSAMYRANGYWRGPIWAPTTALFCDALRRVGQHDAATEIAQRYLRMCDCNGMAENFDALTGVGLHDPAFAWTSAVFLLLGGMTRAD
jgi:putative isomerase